jgi:glycosyltransferase involved in cell wall biosynthesis
VRWTDDVVVFDSFSTDRTVSIARTCGARVFQRQFDDYGSQREAARTQVDYKYPWVLAIDADERPDEELVREMRAAVSGEVGHSAFRMRRKDHFMGQWVKHSTLYPSWFLRLYRPDRVRYEPRAVHEYPTVDGTVGELRGHLIHHSFSKGLGDWFGKHARYAALEARENVKSLDAAQNLDWAGLFHRNDPVRHRRALKDLSVRLPLRPALRFLYMYLLRGGFLDGPAGFTYCRMLAAYELMIVLNMKELRRRERGLPV